MKKYISIIAATILMGCGSPASQSHESEAATAIAVEEAPAEEEAAVEDIDYGINFNDAAEVRRALQKEVKRINHMIEHADELPDDYYVGPFSIEGHTLIVETTWMAEYLSSRDEYLDQCMEFVSYFDPDCTVFHTAYWGNYNVKIRIEIIEPRERKTYIYDAEDLAEYFGGY